MPDDTSGMIDSGTGMTMSYKNLEIWQSARETVIEIHVMTVTRLLTGEMFAEALFLGLKENL